MACVGSMVFKEVFDNFDPIILLSWILKDSPLGN